MRGVIEVAKEQGGLSSPSAVSSFDPDGSGGLTCAPRRDPFVGWRRRHRFRRKRLLIKIKAGAKLRQLYSGLVYKGLKFIEKIKSELALDALIRGKFRRSLSLMGGADATSHDGRGLAEHGGGV